MLKGLVVRIATVTVAMSFAGACHAGSPEHRAPAIGLVEVGRRHLTVSREPGHICVEAMGSPASAAPSCLPADFAFTDSVVSAALGPLDAGADVVALLTQPDVTIDGLGPDRARLVVRSERGADALALWVGVRRAGTPEVSANYAEPDGGAGTVIVHRAVAVDVGEVVDAAAADGCG